MTALLLVLGASQAWVVGRGVVRHLMGKVMWEGSWEVGRWRGEERRVREGFLRGLGAGVEADGEGEGLDGDKKEQGKTSVVNVAHTKLTLNKEFWAYDEGVEEISRLLKEE